MPAKRGRSSSSTKRRAKKVKLTREEENQKKLAKIPLPFRNLRTSGMTGREKKWKDIYAGWTAVGAGLGAANGDPSPANTLAGVKIGTGATQREGRQIDLQSIHIRGAIRLDAVDSKSVAHNGCGLCRIAVVLDRQTNSTTTPLAATTVFQTQTGGNDVLAYRNLDNVRRFHVLRDELVAMNATAGLSESAGTISTVCHVYPFEYNINLYGITQNYSGINDTRGDITDLSVHIFFWKSDEDPMSFTYTSRLRFTG